MGGLAYSSANIKSLASILAQRRRWAGRGRHSLQAVLLSCGLGAKVGVAACTIPVPRNWLGVKRCYHSEVFTHSVQDEPGHPEMVSHLDSFTGSYLEFPLENKKDGLENKAICPPPSETPKPHPLSPLVHPTS